MAQKMGNRATETDLEILALKRLCLTVKPSVLQHLQTLLQHLSS